MIGFLIYLPTVVSVPQYVFLIAGILILLRERQTIFFKKFNPAIINRNLFLLVLIISICTLNRIIGTPAGTPFTTLVPYTVVSLLTYLIAIHLNEKDLKVLVYMICLEVLLAAGEFICGVKSLPGLSQYYDVNSTGELLYNRAVLGLSTSSSNLANKILLAILLIEYVPFRIAVLRILRFVLLAGVVFTFNRTVIIVVLLFYILQLWKTYADTLWLALSNKKMAFTRMRAFLAVSGFILLIALAAGLFHEEIFNQFSRNSSSIQLSGRDLIWNKFLLFIKNHIWFGNFSQKYIVPYFETTAHAHNSYLQVLATHGIIVFSLYILLVLLNFNRNNYTFIFPFLFYSFSQYGIFWGISLMDIIFFYMLFHRSSVSKHLIQPVRT